MKTNRRFLSILLILVMVLGLMQGMSLTAYADDYKLSVGGVQVTSANAGNIDGNNTASYNADTNTLTLNGYSYEGQEVGVDNRGNTALNIEITGGNSITSTSGYGCIVGMDDLIFSGTGTLFLLNRGEGGSAIHNKKDITIKSGTVIANGTKSGIRTENGKVTIKDGTVTATGNSGIFAKEDVIISGGTVNAEGRSGTGISGGTVTIKGGTVKATTNGDNTSGISSTQGTTISGGTVTATGGNGGDGAISGPVKNAIAGTGWTDTAGAEGKANIAISTEGQQLTYKKVQFPGLPVASVTTAPASKDLTYNGSAQVLVDAGTASGGTMQYALGNESGATEAYTTSIPTKTDIGTYYVWYKVAGDDKHNDTDPIPLTVTISPVDKTKLKEAIADAGAYLDTIKDRTEYADAAAQLKKAIDAAKAVAANDNVTQSAVAQAIRDVNGAVDKAKADVAAIDKQAADEAAAKAVVDAINALPNPAGVNDRPAVEAARQAFDALTADQKTLVPADAQKKLTDTEAQVRAAEADEAAAKAVVDAINALPNPAGAGDRPAVEAARQAFDALTADQKTLVPADAQKKLTDTEAQVRAAEDSKGTDKKQAEDQAAAQAATDAINALPNPAGLGDKPAVEAARRAFDALTADQKALVPADAQKRLVAAEEQAQAAEEAAARKRAEDQAAANAVIQTISALPAEAGINDREAVDAARRAFDALTADQKALVPADAQKRLVAAEEQVRAAEEAAKVIDIAGCAITVVDRTYTGKPVKEPAVTVMDGEKKLAEDADYTVVWNHKVKSIGAHGLLVRGIGSYAGEQALTFSINPRGTRFTKLAAGRHSIIAAWKKQAHITRYQIEIGTKKDFSDGRKLVIWKRNTLTRVIRKLEPGKTYYVRIRTYTRVKGRKYYSKWSEAQAVTTIGEEDNAAAQVVGDESLDLGEGVTLPGIDGMIDAGMIDGTGVDGEIELTLE